MLVLYLKGQVFTRLIRGQVLASLQRNNSRKVISLIRNAAGGRLLFHHPENCLTLFLRDLFVLHQQFSLELVVFEHLMNSQSRVNSTLNPRVVSDVCLRNLAIQ